MVVDTFLWLLAGPALIVLAFLFFLAWRNWPPNQDPNRCKRFGCAAMNPRQAMYCRRCGKVLQKTATDRV